MQEVIEYLIKHLRLFHTRHVLYREESRGRSCLVVTFLDAQFADECGPVHNFTIRNDAPAIAQETDSEPHS